jgi:hypothetical protein
MRRSKRIKVPNQDLQAAPIVTGNIFMNTESEASGTRNIVFLD